MLSSPCYHGGASSKGITQVSEKFDISLWTSRVPASTRVRLLLVKAFLSSPPCRAAETPAARQGYVVRVRVQAPSQIAMVKGKAQHR